jgi:hypothetical protein
MSTPNVAAIVNLGPATVVYNSISLGHVNQGGVKVKVKQGLVDAFASRYGKGAPVVKFVDGVPGTDIECPMLQTTDWAALEAAFPGVTKVTNAGNSKLTWGKIAGSQLTARLLVITPDITANATAYPFQCYCWPVGECDITYDGSVVQIWGAKFQMAVDESGGADGSYGATFGDPAISGDATPPTCTVLPADGAVGVSATAGGTITWTFSEALNGNTVKVNKSVLLMLQAGAGASAIVALTSAVLTNNGASTTIVATYPTLAGATIYNAILTREITDLNGNALATGFETNFATA